jgi:hypothetical protein
MGWQTTFTLQKREKGCHLVTEEVLSHIRPGLEGVQVCVAAGAYRETEFSIRSGCYIFSCEESAVLLARPYPTA